MLFLLKVFLDGPLYPYDTSEKDESERREDHQVVRNVSDPVQDIDTEECAAAEELAEEGDDKKDHTVSDTVCYTVKH